jgi:ferredoxin/flavodoxin
MKTAIYYFSGTGNSLAVAKALARGLEGPVNIAPIAGLVTQKEVVIDADVVGIVSPTYFLSIPDIVRSFLKKLTFGFDPYIFTVVTCNGQPGHGLDTTRRLLGQKGESLAYACAVEMPGNCLIGMDFTNPPEVQAERLNRSRDSVEAIAREIRLRRKKIDIRKGSDSPLLHLRGRFMSSFTKYIYRPTRAFRVEGPCSRCGTCVRVCPAGNVTMSSTKGPQWGDECLYCLACLHWCPNRAIEMRQDTVGRTRYHHPGVTVDEMAARPG